MNRRISLGLVGIVGVAGLIVGTTLGVSPAIATTDGYEVISVTSGNFSTPGYHSATATCDSGKVATGGGSRLSSVSGEEPALYSHLVESFLAQNGDYATTTANGFEVTYYTPASYSGSMDTFTIQVNVSCLDE